MRKYQPGFLGGSVLNTRQRYPVAKSMAFSDIGSPFSGSAKGDTTIAPYQENKVRNFREFANLTVQRIH